MKRLIILIMLFLIAGPALATAGVNVAVSIKPLHSIASNIMLGVAEPDLIVSTGGSPHGYNLRPSEARMLQQADLVFWIGPELEEFLEKPLHNGSHDKAHSLLDDVPQLQVLSTRAAGVWQNAARQDDGHGHKDEHGHAHDHGGIDSHIWLNPDNALLIAETMLKRLIETDPDNEAVYRANYAAFRQKLTTLDQRLARQLQPLSARKYLIFHDAYQYFERHYGLKPVGALAIDPDRRPGARRLIELKKAVREQAVACVFTEPQFEPRLVEVLTEGTSAKTGVLDPLGSALQPGPDLYFQLLSNMATSLKRCLDTREYANGAQ